MLLLSDSRAFDRMPFFKCNVSPTFRKKKYCHILHPHVHILGHSSKSNHGFIGVHVGKRGDESSAGRRKIQDSYSHMRFWLKLIYATRKGGKGKSIIWDKLGKAGCFSYSRMILAMKHFNARILPLPCALCIVIQHLLD